MSDRERCDSDRECFYLRSRLETLAADLDNARAARSVLDHALARVREVLAAQAAPAMLQVVRWASTTPDRKDLRPDLWRCNACGSLYSAAAFPGHPLLPPHAACVSPGCHAATAARVAFLALAAQVDPRAPAPAPAPGQERGGGDGRLAPTSPVCNLVGCRVPFPHDHNLF